MAENYPDVSTQPDLPSDQGDNPTEDEVTASSDPVADTARRKLQEELTALRKSNQEKYRALLRTGEIPNPTNIMLARLESLIDLVLDETARLGLDYTFEQRMTTILNECLAQARQKQIAVPAHTAPAGLIVPGQ